MHLSEDIATALYNARHLCYQDEDLMGKKKYAQELTKVNSANAER